MTGATAAATRFERVPVIPEPPHDPTSILIDARTDWQLQEPTGLDGLDVSTCDGAISLALRPDVMRQFTEASGSFGGLVLPSNVAVASDGSIFLLDRSTRTLKRFDPCCCRFVDVPCLGGHRRHRPVAASNNCGQPSSCDPVPRNDARGLRNPGGIAICCDVLYVADTGRDGRLATGTSARRNALRARIRRDNHRVSVFVLPGFELRGHLRPPTSQFPRWRPVAVACNPDGGIWVADELNGVVHHFGSRGWSKAVITGLDSPEELAIDLCGRVYVVDRSIADGQRRLRVFDQTGGELKAPARVAEAADRFCPLPFPVSADGRLSLGSLCASSCSASDATFDLNGEPIDPPAPIPAPYLTSGTYASRALDSRTRGCQWHRLVVDGELPLGTRIRVETFCADEEYDADQVAGFGVWHEREIVPGPPIGSSPGIHECLVPSPPGRFLWLRLTLLGTGAATPVVRALVLEFPRLSSLRYLPAVFAAEPASADFTARFLSLFDTTFRGIEREVDTEARLFDPMSTPAERVGRAPIDFLSWLASWIGVSFDRSWSQLRRRQFLKVAGRLFARRGTVDGLRQQLLQWLGWDPPIDCSQAAHACPPCVDRPRNCAPEPERRPYRTPPLILEHFRLRRWLFVGAGRLGAQAVLWGQEIVNRTQLDRHARAGRTRLVMTPDPKRDPLHFYAHAFTVFVPACIGRTEGGRKSMDNLLRRESPAHTKWDIAYVEPRFRIGVQSMIGFDAVVGCLPPAARLGNSPLGVASLVGSATRRDGRKELRAGRSGRLGTGSQLH